MTKIDDGRAEYAKRSRTQPVTTATNNEPETTSAIEQGRQAWRDRHPQRGGAQ
jgi:hypothetical protein